MTFEYTWLLLLLAPLWYCLYRCREKMKSINFVHLKFFAPQNRLFRWEWIIKALIILLLIIAWASPIIVDKQDPLNRKGIDIVLAIDGSGSMNSSGFDEESRDSRFEITQKIAQEFIVKREEDNVGVVLFGDFAFIASPVTYEKEIVSEMVGYLSHGMAGQNTAIGEGIAMSLRALEHSQAKSKVIILLTDGEHNSGSISPKDAAQMAKHRGVKIYTVGMGNAGEFDKVLLEKIANDSGGAFFAAYNKDELYKAYDEINTLEASNIKSRAYQVKDYYFQWPLIGVLLLLMWLLLQRRQR